MSGYAKLPRIPGRSYLRGAWRTGLRQSDALVLLCIRYYWNCWEFSWKVEMQFDCKHCKTWHLADKQKLVRLGEVAGKR